VLGYVESWVQCNLTADRVARKSQISVVAHRLSRCRDNPAPGLVCFGPEGLDVYASWGSKGGNDDYAAKHQGTVPNVGMLVKSTEHKSGDRTPFMR
jgi:hypothetical protein